MNTIIQVEGLQKKYGEMAAVDGISFEVQEGEIFGMVGPNGAGKTTTIECLEGLWKPDRGMIRVLGMDPQNHGHALKECTGMQLQESNLPARMRVWEALDLYATFYPTAADWRKLLVQLGLEEKQNTPFSKLSGGQKQRLFIALALLPEPNLIFLDELTTGLDPQARHTIWDLVRDVRSNGKTVMLTTHFMEEAERLCDRVFTVEGSLPEDFKKNISGKIQFDIEGNRVVVHGTDQRKTPLVSEVVNQLTAQHIPFHDLRTEQPNLEDVFLSLTGRRMRE